MRLITSWKKEKMREGKRLGVGNRKSEDGSRKSEDRNYHQKIIKFEHFKALQD